MIFEDSVFWKRQILHLVARVLGVLIHIEGMPHGSSRNVDFSRYESGGSAAT